MDKSFIVDRVKYYSWIFQKRTFILYWKIVDSLLNIIFIVLFNNSRCYVIDIICFSLSQ